jgi:hypothetical protein
MDASKMDLDALDLRPEGEYAAHLDALDNLTQLALLREEIQSILQRSTPPPPSWYTQRIRKIYTYAELNWAGFAADFEGKNTELYRTALHIQGRLAHLITEWSCGPDFSLEQYAALLNEIASLWTTYHTTYVGNETDEDILDIIQDMTHMHT